MRPLVLFQPRSQVASLKLSSKSSYLRTAMTSEFSRQRSENCSKQMGKEIPLLVIKSFEGRTDRRQVKGAAVSVYTNNDP